MKQILLQVFPTVSKFTSGHVAFTKTYINTCFLRTKNLEEDFHFDEIGIASIPSTTSTWKRLHSVFLGSKEPVFILSLLLLPRLAYEEWLFQVSFLIQSLKHKGLDYNLKDKK